MNESSPKQGSLPSGRPIKLGPKTRRLWAILYLAVKRYMQIDGAQWARAFAFSAFLSLFPLMIVL